MNNYDSLFFRQLAAKIADARTREVEAILHCDILSVDRKRGFIHGLDEAIALAIVVERELNGEGVYEEQNNRAKQGKK